MVFLVFAKAALLLAGIIWCVEIIRRLPSDIPRLRELYQKYRCRRDEAVLQELRNTQSREEYQRNCEIEFWTDLGVHAFLFWPITFLIMWACVLFVVFRIVIPVVRAFG